MLISAVYFVSLLGLIPSLFVGVSAHGRPRPKTCVVEPACDGSDDAPSVIKAFQECGKNGKVVFLNETYHINSIMNTTGLDNCEIDLKGTLLVSVCDSSIDKADKTSGARIFPTG